MPQKKLPALLKGRKKAQNSEAVPQKEIADPFEGKEQGQMCSNKANAMANPIKMKYMPLSYSSYI